MGSYIMGIVFDPDQKSHFLQFFYDRRPCLIAVHTLELSAVGIDGRVVVHNIDLRQAMAFSHFKIVRVVGGSDFYHAGSKFHVHIGIRYDRHFPVHQREHDLSSY